MGGIGIIHNPFAKGNLKRPWIAPKLRELVEEVGQFRETRNINELPEVADDLLNEKVEIIAVNGGDGTLHLVITAFVKVAGDRPLPKIMSLRGGTMNTMSNSLKIKGKTMSILETAVAKYKAGEKFDEKEQHLLKVNDMYGFMSGAGIVAKFLDAYYSGSSTGPWQAAKLVSKTIAGALVKSDFTTKLFDPVPMRVTVDGEDLGKEEYSVILACTIEELGLGFTPTPRAYEKPGQFHFIGTDIRPLQLLPSVPKLYVGKDLTHPRVQFTGPTPEAIVEPKGELRYMIDGEMYTTDEPIHYSVGPTVTVATP